MGAGPVLIGDDCALADAGLNRSSRFDDGACGSNGACGELEGLSNKANGSTCSLDSISADIGAAGEDSKCCGVCAGDAKGDWLLAAFAAGLIPKGEASWLAL